MFVTDLFEHNLTIVSLCIKQKPPKLGAPCSPYDTGIIDIILSFISLMSEDMSAYPL